jgi:hypothetical protein
MRRSVCKTTYVSESLRLRRDSSCELPAFELATTVIILHQLSILSADVSEPPNHEKPWLGGGSQLGQVRLWIFFPVAHMMSDFGFSLGTSGSDACSIEAKLKLLQLASVLRHLYKS